MKTIDIHIRHVSGVGYTAEAPDAGEKTALCYSGPREAALALATQITGQKKPRLAAVNRRFYRLIYLS